MITFISHFVVVVVLFEKQYVPSKLRVGICDSNDRKHVGYL